MLQRIFWLIVTLSCLATPALAGVEPRSFTLSPMVGDYRFEGNQSLDHAPFGSVALGYNLTKLAALEVVFLAADAAASDTSTTDTTVKAVRLDALYHFSPDSKLVPYVAVGTGGIRRNPKGGEAVDHYLANYGLGIKYFVTNHVALRVDVRHLLDFDKPNNNLLYSAGLLIQFDAQGPAVQR